ncbi:MAG: DNA replication and repair protein RecF [Acholeplasma sp.]|nr:DNA replication and repair protein RecF [Acholeplasma sp.]
MIKKINLNNFRIHNEITLKLSKNFIYITGPNGSGKTSILEAIYYLSTTKSHRTNNDLDVIRKDEPFAKMSLETNINKYQMVISEKGKIASINNKEVRKLSEFIGNLKVIMFSPEDLNIVKGSPSVRRSFIDLELLKISRPYLTNLNTYKNILKQRNMLLKNLTITDDFIFLNILGKQLYDVGIRVINERKQFIADLDFETKKVYQKLSGHKIELIYKPNVNETDFLQHINKNQKQDIMYKATISGPHRDDLTILFNDRDATFASQGEIRLIVVAIKLGLLSVIKNWTKDEVILLLDDVLSELDSNVQTKVLNDLPDDIQVIMNSAIKIKSDKIQIIELENRGNMNE